jgi:hypothetical protein
METPQPASSGPIAGLKIVEMAGIGPVSVLRNDARRHGRLGRFGGRDCLLTELEVI